PLLQAFPPPPSSNLFPYTTLVRSRVLHQANAAGLVGHHFDQPGFGKRHDVLERHATRGEAEGLGNLAKALWLALRDDAFEIAEADRKSTRLNSSHVKISYAVFCLK